MLSFHYYYLDPHFKLMNGNYMSYHGQCDILLSRIESFASGLGLEVHIRTTRVDRSVNMAYSYISGAAVRIGSDVLEVLESGMLLINGDAATAQLVNEEEGRGNAAVADHRDHYLFLVTRSSLLPRAPTGASSSTTWTSATAIMFRFVQIP